MRIFFALLFAANILFQYGETGLCYPGNNARPTHDNTMTESGIASDDAASFFSDNLTEKERQWLKAHPVIRIGFAADRPPFEFIDAVGREYGIVADYLSLVGKRLHVAFIRARKEDGTPLSWDEIQAAGRKKELDLLCSLVQTRERDAYFGFTRPYLDFPWAVITRHNHGSSGDITNFYGRKVAVVEDYPIFKRLPVLHPKLQLVPVKTPLEGLTTVSRGQADAFINNVATAAYLIKQRSLKQLEIVGTLGGCEAQLRMGVRRDWPELVDILDKALASLTPQERATIHNRWILLEMNKGFNWRQFFKIGTPALLFGIVIVTGIVIANRRLGKEVAARRQAEIQALNSREEMRKSEERLRFSMKVAGAYYWQFDVSSRLVSYTTRDDFTQGNNHEQKAPQTLEQIIAISHPDDQPFLRKAVEQTLQEGTPLFKIDHRVPGEHPSTWIWQHTVGRPVEWDEQGRMVTIAGLTTDITERQNLLEQIQQAGERLHFSLETAGAFYWQVNFQTGAMLFDSLHFFKQIGFSEQNVPRTHEEYFSLLHPDDQGRFTESVRQYEEGAIPLVNLDFRLARKDGGWIWVNHVGRAIEWDEQGRVIVAAGLVFDITERMDLLEQIKQSRERLQIISEHTYDWQSWRDLNGNLVWVNQAVERITGFSPQECMKMEDYPRSFIDNRDLEIFNTHNNLVRKGYGRQEFALRVRRKDKGRAWVFMALEPILDNSGQISGIASVSKDITDQKQAERELHLMSKVFEDATDPIQILDLTYRIVDLNEATLAAYGYTREELLGESISIIVPDQAHAHGEELCQSCIDGEMVRNIERFRRKKDGTIVPILLTLSLLKTDEGKPLGIASITKDISELKRAEKELKEYRDHLESLVEERTADLEEAMQVAKEATRAKSDFLANMSHEIRTPLNAVIGFSHLALQTKLNDQQFDYVHKIQSSSKALLGVINDILDFSKIEAGKLSMESIEFDLEEVLDNVTNLIGIKAQQKGLEVIFNIEPTLPRVLIGDPLRLGQVLTNLTGNAVKFTEKGEIVLGCTLLQDNADEVELEFYVQDSGIGLTRDQQAELFQAFSQADSSTTRKYGGSGLGLFISKSLVEMMGGRIRVRSEIGRGATFFFTARLKKADRQPASPPLLDAELHGIKVLVVDDNPICRAALHKMLEVMSFRVTQADSAEAAFAELEMTGGDDPFDLVLMDWKMPGMDGLHASERIRNSLKLNVPSIIMVSAYAREDLMQQADSMGLDGYLVKPVSPSLLLDTIMTALGRQRPSRVSSDRQSDASPGVETIRGARLLVVEDNEINQQVARGILEHIGIIVEMADNGRLAIEALQKAGYDAVLMDIHMPEMDGYTAARQIRKDPAFNDLPIIAMTANAMAGDREKALDAGMSDHVAKPIDVNELLDVLRKWINPSDKNPLPPPAASATEEEVATRAKALGPLPGIDTREGLRRLAGDVSLYRKLLCSFAGSQSKTAERIARALEAPDLDVARGLAHTTKGVAGNIGAMQLYETASQLDLALKNENLQKAQELLPVFSDRLGTVIRSASTLEEENKGETECKAGIPAPDAIQPLLRNLYELLEEDDTAAGGVVRQLTGAVESDAGKDLLSRLSRQIGGYEFEAAKSTLHDLCLKLNIHLEE